MIRRYVSLMGVLLLPVLLLVGGSAVAAYPLGKSAPKIEPLVDPGLPSGTPAHVVFTNDLPDEITHGNPVTLTAQILDNTGVPCANGTEVIFADIGFGTAFVGGDRAKTRQAYIRVPVTNGIATVDVRAVGRSRPVSIGVYRINDAIDPSHANFGTLISPLFQVEETS